MRIKEIYIDGLFGIFDHVIPLNMDERITIIHGPNGFGKTIILRMINGFFNSQDLVFETIPFSSFKIKFHNDSSLEIKKDTEDRNKTYWKNIFTFNFQQPDLEPLDFKQKGKEIFSDIEEDIDIFTRLHRGGKEPADSEELKTIKNSIHVRLIESQRLVNDSESSEPSSTVSAYSQELAKLMQDKFTEYASTSQSLDRTFPARIVKQKPSPDITNEQLRHQLEELEVTRSRFIQVGLLNKDEDSDFTQTIDTQEIDDNIKNILSVYIEDMEKKLSVFDEIAQKIELLGNIFNKKIAYSYKEINFSKDKGFIFTTNYNSDLSNYKTLSSTDLSSGEQHELVLLYELLFKVEPNSLILIDEPEISLHLGWQIQFLKDLQEIIKLVDLDIVMATHSPDIIQDRWDLTVELKEPGK